MLFDILKRGTAWDGVMIVEKIRQSPTKCLLISDPRMDRAEKFWDKLADTFDRRVLKHCGQYYIWTVENTKQYLNRSDVVLDYACGTGIIAIEIAQNVKEIYAIDISLKMIEAAKIKTYDVKLKIYILYIQQYLMRDISEDHLM